MKTIEGYSKEKYTNNSVLLAGGGAKALSDFELKIASGGTTALQSATYEGLYCASGESVYRVLFIVKPTTYTDIFYIKYRLKVSVPGTNKEAYRGDYTCEFWGYGNSLRAYKCQNAVQIYPVYYHSIGLANDDVNALTYGHWIGFYQNGNNYNSSSFKRTITVEILDYYNCSPNFCNAVPANKFPYNGSTIDILSYCKNISNIVAYSSGLYETGDDNDLYSIRTANSRVIAGTNGISRYSLIAMDSEGNFQSLITGSSSLATAKTLNTAKFRMNPVLYRHSGSRNISNGSPCDTYTIYRMSHSLDMRYENYVYSDWTPPTDYRDKPLYIQCTIDTNCEWTPAGKCLTTILTSGYYYIYVGEVTLDTVCWDTTNSYYASYIYTLSNQHPVYYYDGTRLMPWVREWVKTGNIGTMSVDITGAASCLRTDATMKLYAQYNNEINFGGTSTSDNIYIGYRATDNKPIPTTVIFGGPSGSSTIKAGTFKKSDGTEVSYVGHTHNEIKAQDLRNSYPAQIANPKEMKISFLKKETVNLASGDNAYFDVITVRSYGDSSAGKDNALLFGKTNGTLYHTTFDFGSTDSWGTPLKILDSNNYTTFDGIAKGIAAKNWIDSITEADTDKVINKWSEIIKFVEDFNTDNTLATEFTKYLPLAGGTLTGELITNSSITSTCSGPAFYIHPSSGWAYMRMRSGNSTYWDIATTSSRSYALEFRLNGVDPTTNSGMLLTTDGKLGIGTSSPSYNLHVVGNSYTTGRFISAVATGTAPISVTSTTVCSNLNADLVDGLHVHAGQNSEANKIVRTDDSGYLQCGWINTESGGFSNRTTVNGVADVPTAVSRIYCSEDAFIRYLSPAMFKRALGLAERVHFGTTASNSGWYKISINSYNSWMLAFTVRLYQNYKYYDICFSGYNYGSNWWYAPAARLLGSTADSIEVKFGHDSTAYHLWVAVPAAAYTGIDIIDCTNGYTQVDNIGNLFTITNEASLSGTITNTFNLKRPALVSDLDSYIKKDGTASQFVKANGSFDSTVYLPHTTWTCTVKGATWSRLCYIPYNESVIGSSFILNVAGTRNNVVYNETFVVNVNHGTNCSIVKIGTSQYTPISLRITSNSSGDCYVELNDSAQGISSSTTQSVYCRVLGIRTGTIITYTAFTDGTTLASGFTANATLTTNSAGLQSNLTIVDLSNYVKKNGDTMTGLLVTTSGNTHKGIRVGDTYINAIGGELIFQNNTAIRFGGDSWDYSGWAGLKYVSSSKTIYLGLADGSVFNKNNSAVTEGILTLTGISKLNIGDSGDYNLNVNGTAGATAFYQTSDIRLKNIESEINLNIKDIAELPIFNFSWNTGEEGKYSGTSAQDVQKILPNLVSGEDKLSLNYSSLGTILGITDAREIVSLKKRIAELEKIVKHLNTIINEVIN